MTEVWRKVVGFENYQVSSVGRVCSYQPRWNKPRLLKPKVQTKGYAGVQLAKDGKSHNRSVHRLVAEAFIPNPDGLPQVNHLNFDKLDNRVENLEWATALRDAQHRMLAGKFYFGEAHHNCKLSDVEVSEIRVRGREGVPKKQIAREFGIKPSYVRLILAGRARTGPMIAVSEDSNNG